MSVKIYIDLSLDILFIKWSIKDASDGLIEKSVQESISKSSEE